MSAINLIEQSGFDYVQPLWGDLIYGSKEQLQAIGIAVGLPFPGEPGAPKRELKFTDPRGLAGTVKPCTYREVGIFTASIPFPGRSQDDSWKPFAFGVRKSEDAYWADFYKGSPEALVAAGLLAAEQVPGRDGVPKTSARFTADGSLLKGRTDFKEPGSRWVNRVSKGSYFVAITLTPNEQQMRKEALEEARFAWEGRMRRLPRPAPLVTLVNGEMRAGPILQCINGGRLHSDESRKLMSTEYQRDGNVIQFPRVATVLERN